MPQWGRPPGAQMGRHNQGGRAPWVGSTRVEEIVSGDEEERDDAYGRELVRKARVAYGRELEFDNRGPRGRYGDEDIFDEAASVEGGEYDLYDHEDSTVAYAVQLAMRDKEDHLVDQALERIRRAQMLGRKNVRLSQRELDALERRRQQADEGTSSGARRSRPSGAAATSRPVSRRGGLAAPEQPSASYPHGAQDPHWNPAAHARPRTPTMQSLRPRQSTSPIRPTSSQYFNPATSTRPPPLQQPVYPRPLPDDPQWAPSYYNPLQMAHYGADQFPMDPLGPADPRAAAQFRMSYPLGMPSHQVPHPSYAEPRQVPDPTKIRVPRRGRVESPPESANDEERAKVEISDDEDDDVRIVKVVERTTPMGFQRKKVPESQRTSRGGRTRKIR
ncbi:hypothetical protein POX_e06564 [Penicillium oxalicum]|uniref:hypothetical protein n=1 Tax=Penicillium oxalicum TaxID=69781 RepID=UPI0020B846B7|nr:hypothetical protein POX_e06564 [Penicillium oxalicum]KAI2788545.1 hypothetical protein POX_e06564 [Penicillium oxalicum]